MHFPALFATSLAVAGAASAHGTPGVPKIFGRRTVAELKARGILGSKREAASRPARAASEGIAKRQVGGTDGQCGPGVGSCATGYCCSPAGWCGLGTDYCAAPDCQFNYGSGCDANQVPAGDSTSSVSRDHVGSVSYGGAGIYDCTVPNMIALTYDDGPYIYTSDILDILSANNVPATFFITGNNLGKGEIDNAAYPWSSIIQRMHTDGHQIASHTWSHQDLSTEVTQEQRLNQMYYNEMALRNILGFFPTYMRPPYSSCTSGSGCESDMGTLGYHITYFDLDTEDYLNDSPTKIQTSKNDFTDSLSSSDPATDNWLVIGHDIHEQTAHNLTQFMITYAKDQGWTFGTVGQCLGDPEANWYRSSSGSVFTSTTSTPEPTSTSTTTSNPGTSPTAISLDGTCGGSSGYTCQGSSFGDCCSQYGWCGSTTNYCDTGCQSEFGTCSSSGTATTTTSSSGSSSTLAVSLDGTCGGTSGNTCQGSTFGDCCSQYGWCGSTSAYCADGCQTSFGTCN